jgi:hypothetical protein
MSKASEDHFTLQVSKFVPWFVLSLWKDQYWVAVPFPDGLAGEAITNHALLLAREPLTAEPETFTPTYPVRTSLDVLKVKAPSLEAVTVHPTDLSSSLNLNMPSTAPETGTKLAKEAVVKLEVTAKTNAIRTTFRDYPRPLYDK